MCVFEKRDKNCCRCYTSALFDIISNVNTKISAEKKVRDC